MMLTTDNFSLDYCGKKYHFNRDKGSSEEFNRPGFNGVKEG